MAWTAPRTWVAGEIVTASIMNTHIRDNLLEVVQRGGSVPLTANWDAGSYEIRAETLESDVVTGTAPLTVASTTLVTNLNADQVDGQSRAININADHTHQSTGAEAGTLDHGLALTGLTDDDHTQYQKESLLTTAGDLPYATAASTWARLGIGTANQWLRTNAGATAPEWATGAIVSKLGTHARDMTAASGAVGYTGYGFIPRALFILANWTGDSIGIGDDDLGEMCMYRIGGATAWNNATSQCVHLEDASSNNQTAVLTTLDADGFTLTWTKSLSPTGNATLMVLALG